MELDPSETIGGNLTFVPQLYDRWERAALKEVLRPDSTFVDLGANIGSYTLWASLHIGPAGRIFSIEADPTNYRGLETNVRLNNLSNVVLLNVGASDAEHDLPLHLNTNHNRGGHTFLDGVHDSSKSVTVTVHCRPLADILTDAGAVTVDVMKLDIEGFEARVMAKYFSDLPEGSRLRPRHILTELYGGDKATDLSEVLVSNGYQLVRKEGVNAWYQSQRRQS